MLSPDSFWRFACDVYRNTQVQQVLLECQDLHGKNVNLCLLLDYLTTYSIQLTELQVQALAACAADTDKTLLHPYRTTRQQVKKHFDDYPEYATLRKSLLSTELELEKLQQHCLIELVTGFDLERSVQQVSNLELYLPKQLVTRFEYAKT
ncbi:TIGR02444 family protein [Pseudoalteromonas luteoviolacea]|uniref:TIGR02444 family protein n=1 Tax=Pseudoalteromonas luteoviolacea H33 TaxID=1365251 RepID=A0A162AIF0_9GAMM|nr:TIGR02444 family protein [Pseudoalteromonas luteoviolacea]KZN50419.1 hypothetical protein N476_16360 [Pseudoalteromonas luteoviolacea H33]KZN77932.1 hypothetical protein N477_11105 [Pseudoalteromonas luteoviolacea H33-S]MBQ4879493.1 TIGR02444 family protein [Pseudoalteromonas luteoviolacea]MBQ4908580.1 TIGR02444 family protein [Pseudoalteromonas luteoviolacea]